MTAIIKMQQSLARKAATHRDHCFEDLYHLLCRKEWIEAALQHVLSNDGATTPGVDGMSWKDFNDTTRSDFEQEAFRDHFIQTLQQELKTRTFHPLPVRRVEIPKPGTTKTRKLGIPTIKDRVVQTLLKMVLEPIWEADFSWFSNGFRPGRCTMDCIQPLYRLGGVALHYTWVIEGDIRACFDKIPHAKLLAEVSRRIADRHVLTLIRRFLKSGVMSGGTRAPTEEGTPQGGIASPLLANIYLHRFDAWFSEQYARPAIRRDAKRWERKRQKGGPHAAACLFRYADDWIILVRGTKAQTQEIKEQAGRFLGEELGLELSEEKTAITHIREGFDFLGYHVFRCERPADRRRVGLFVRPADKCVRRFKQKIKDMTSRKTLKDDELLKLQAINAVVRGWANYYRAVNPMETFQKLDRYVWLRLRKWLQKKYRLGPMQVMTRYMHRRAGPQGGWKEFALWDEANGRWVWRYRAQQTRLAYHRPSFKQHWPNPYLEPVKAEPYVLPTLKTMWNGTTEAPLHAASRREVLGRAKGHCERCGNKAKVIVHHKNRVKGRPRDQADNRPEMLEALCEACHWQEHRAERIYRNKARRKDAATTG